MRLLIATGAVSPSVDEVPETVRLLLGAADEILVMSPTLPKRLDWLASDIDKAREQADRRLDRVLRQLEELDAAVERAGTGADEPVLAFEQAIAEFEPDHILISLRGQESSDWQEHGLVDELLARFALPLTVFVTGR